MSVACLPHVCDYHVAGSTEAEQHRDYNADDPGIYGPSFLWSLCTGIGAVPCPRFQARGNGVPTLQAILQFRKVEPCTVER